MSAWADQGVLLLNATLTVRANLAGSHQGRGWENFTDAVIRTISDLRENVVFLLWGKYAQNKNKDGRLYSVSFTANVIKEAPVLILILKSKDDEWDRYDALSVGAAIENMCLRSTELNLGTLWIGDTDFVENEILDMTKHNDMELVSSLVIGYPNQEPKMRPRKDLEEIVEYYE